MFDVSVTSWEGKKRSISREEPRVTTRSLSLGFLSLRHCTRHHESSMFARSAALFLRALANDYQERLRDDCVATCSRRAFSLDIFSADNDPDLQRHQIEQFSKKSHRVPSAILVSPVRERELLPVAFDAVRKGLAWISLNRSSGYLRELREQFPGSLVFSVTPDQHEIGTLQGRQFKLMLPEGGDVFYLRGPVMTSSAQRRLFAVEREIAETPIRMVTFTADWTGEAAEKATRDWIRAARDIDPSRCLVGAQNDDMAMGARRGLMNEAVSQGRPDLRRIHVTGCDGSPTYGQRWVAEGELLATVEVPSVAGKAIDDLAAALDGTRHPAYEVSVASSSYPPLEVLADRLAMTERRKLGRARWSAARRRAEGRVE
jgi:ABC-type sugar transport system substrate-binding protein